MFERLFPRRLRRHRVVRPAREPVPQPRIRYP
jgi:hypothetical protein